MPRRAIKAVLLVVFALAILSSIAWADSDSLPVDDFSGGDGQGSQTSTIVAVGSGTTTSTKAPWTSYYFNSESVMLYSASEIDAAAGSIKSIGFRFSATDKQIHLNFMRIYIGTTTDTAFSSSTVTLPADLKLVYEDVTGSSSLNNTMTAWQSFEFNKGSFYWDGTSNLVVVVVTDASNEASGMPKVFATSTSATGNTVVYNRTDTHDTFTTATPGAAFTGKDATNVRPDLRLSIDTSASPSDTVTGVKGDINNDGEVDIADAQVALSLAHGVYDSGTSYDDFMAWWSDQDASLSAIKEFADVNGDGALDISDAIAIQAYAQTGCW